MKHLFQLLNKSVVLGFIILLTSSFSTMEKNFTTSTYVYICDSSGGKKYHFNKSCRGLSRCSHPIRKISLEKAQSIGKTLCGWED